MINGFESFTHDLSEYELETLLPVVVSGLGTKKGKEKAITNKVMCERLKERGYKTSEPRLRKIINLIRTEGILPGLIASSLGYYISTSAEEIETYCQSLTQRSNAIIAVRKSYADYLQTLKRTA